MSDIPAFPVPDNTTGGSGMTLRDYFAGQALMGMLADHTGVPIPERFAQLSYEIADAMLKERAK